MARPWGVTATVERPTTEGTDRLGNPVPGEPETEVVHGVLVAPGATSNLDASRQAGVRSYLTLHFPKGYAGSLRGCTVTLPAPWGGPWRVVGDPMPYDDSLTPGPWHMPVEVVACDG